MLFSPHGDPKFNACGLPSMNGPRVMVISPGGCVNPSREMPRRPGQNVAGQVGS